jgi:serine protease Do
MNFSPRIGDHKRLVGGVSVGTVAIFCAFGVLAQTAPAPGGPVNTPSAAPAAAATMPSFADIVEKVAPAVVSIDVQKKPSTRAAQLQLSPFGFGPDSDGLPFSLRPRAPQNEDEAPARRGPSGVGSGFFISADGYIVTNNHVISNAEKITVRTTDERELTATLVGADEATDLAVLKVEGGGYPYVSFQNQARPRVGDWVIAVGNPFNLGGTATAGIVSALHRAQPGSNYVDFMQIDAPINRGNSGGPTFDIHGRVVGVNTAIYSPTGGSVGIGFDIPADVAESVARQLIAEGKVTRGYIGATVQDAPADMAESVGLGERRAAILVDLVPNGPSEQAGLRPGDIVLKVGDAEIRSATDLTRQVATARAGESIRMEIWREGRRQTISVRSGTRPDEARLASNSRTGPAAPQPEPASAPAVLGMRVVPGDNGGVTVQSVVPNSSAAEKGLQRGDLIVSAGSLRTDRQDDLASAVAKARRDGRSNLLLLVERAGRKIFIPVEIGLG